MNSSHSPAGACSAIERAGRFQGIASPVQLLLEGGRATVEATWRGPERHDRGQAIRGIPVLGAHKGYTRTQQVIADVRAFGGGMDVAHWLARANIVTNKNLLPSDRPQDWDRPSGLRLGTIEVTRLGMREKEMDIIADFMGRVLIDKQSPDTVVEDVIEFRQGYQTLFYNFDHGLPPQ